MKGLLPILRIYACNIFNLNRLRHARDKRERRRLAASLIGFTLIGLLLLCLCTGYCVELGISLRMVGQLRLLPALMMTAASLVTLFASVYKSQSMLFQAKDHDQLMSLPVSTGTVAAARLVMLYGNSLFYSIFLLLPAGVIYAILARPGVWFYPAYFLCGLAVPLIPTIVASVVGALIARVSVRFQRKNAVSILLGLLLTAAIILLFPNMNSMEGTLEDLGAIGAELTETLFRIWPPVRWFDAATAGESPLYLLLFLGVSSGLFLLFTWGLGKCYRRFCSAFSAVKRKKKHPLRKSENMSPLKALFLKEWRRYLSSPLYVMNTAVGPLLMTVASAALLIAGKETLYQAFLLPELQEKLPLLLPVALAFLVALSCTTSSSISLEGKQFWILKTLPVLPAEIFAAKLLVNLLLTIPAILLNGTLMNMALQPSAAVLPLYYLVPGAYAFFMALMGLVFNLRWPRFDWNSETQVIKQGMATGITIMVGMSCTLLPLFLLFALPVPEIPVLYGLVLLLLAGSFLLWRRLCRQDGARLMKL